MTVTSVRVVAPSRLHFGMLSFGRAEVRQFGGAGLMVDQPGWEIRLQRCPVFSASGPVADRAAKFAAAVAAHWRLPGDASTGLPACRIEVANSPRLHVGLGTGTQLGLSIAAGLHALFRGGPVPEAPQLAIAAGRAERSAIGSHGFALGGLIVEGGKLVGEAVSPLVCRQPFPPGWRLLLACHQRGEGLSGDEERRAFDQIPPVSLELTAELCRLLLMELLPAVALADFSRASRALYRYGTLAGSCFATQQGGNYSSNAAELTSWFRGAKIEGVGQSSWGPLVFALAPDEPTARHWCDRLLADSPSGPLDTWITAANNRGARVEVTG